MSVREQGSMFFAMLKVKNAALDTGSSCQTIQFVLNHPALMLILSAMVLCSVLPCVEMVNKDLSLQEKVSRLNTVILIYCCNIKAL